MLNKVILIGRLGRDPEHRTTQSGKPVCTFTLATDTGYGDNKRTDWHTITVFDKAADNCVKLLHKGSLAYVDGRIYYDTYEKEGIRHTTTKIIASTVMVIATKVNAKATTNGAPHGPGKSDNTFEGYPLDDESFPF